MNEQQAKKMRKKMFRNMERLDWTSVTATKLTRDEMKVVAKHKQHSVPTIGRDRDMLGFVHVPFKFDSADISIENLIVRFDFDGNPLSITGKSIVCGEMGCGKTHLMKYILQRSQDNAHSELGNRLVMYWDCNAHTLPDNISDFMARWIEQNNTCLTFDIVWKLLQNEWVVICFDNVNNDARATEVGELIFSVDKVGDAACVIGCDKDFEDGVYEGVNWACNTNTCELIKPDQDDIDYAKEDWMLERLAIRVVGKMGVKKDKIKLDY